MFKKSSNSLIFEKNGETVKIEPWGTDSLRIRATMNPEFTKNTWGLTETVKNKSSVKIEISDSGASISNGKLSAKLNAGGVITFEKNGKKILQEYHRSYDHSASNESIALKVVNRQYKGNIGGGEYQITARFNPNDDEKIFGMGQYQQPYLNLKGCVLELAQRNSQITIPFAVSSLGYGFLWNNPAVGRVTFATNMTEWKSECSDELDYWITAGNTPKEITERYTECVGRAPLMPKDYLGFWQCKLRYRTQEEVLTVARKYKELGIHLDVIVIDFFHWCRQGDWSFDKEYWPDPKAMCDELHAMGTKVMVSVWPSVDKKSVNYWPLAEKGLFLRCERGVIQTYDFNGDCRTIDLTAQEARNFLWKACLKNYVKYGIDMFWLDNAEPDLSVYDFENYRYRIGPALKVSNLYPKLYAQTFADGFNKIGKKNFVNLERCAWVGSQKYGVVLWNGDVQSTFECLEDSVSQGINMGLAGIPWWTTDVGGFMYGDPKEPAFIHLLMRWFEFGVFTPILRLHGDRSPQLKPFVTDRDYGGGFCWSGQDNEIWSYGKDAQKIMEKQIKLRESLRDYIEILMKEAHEKGTPLMRAMFYEFPEDENCWNIRDQYMFGNEYLVAPVLHAEEYKRSVYLPAGNWKNINDGKVYKGGKSYVVNAPIDCIPVFKKA
ncbi:TIM-barrel domain-containing protein [Treponema sp.]|uniref:glycoside hydrolase family 31 protein n=1 Tax=Treponema sp. TaxID=166 RepID=UPI002579BB4F|nr:TIM-barrel domain-containing protein [Treponema sp.]MBE6353360.1 glycoside hydrolase family 31 protein [Treponema sp.]